MRPDRLVVGEVRGPEALDLLLAMNCGIPAAGTVHANSAEDAVDRLTGLPLLAGPNISAEFARRSVASCVDLIVHWNSVPTVGAGSDRSCRSSRPCTVHRSAGCSTTTDRVWCVAPPRCRWDWRSHDRHVVRAGVGRSTAARRQSAISCRQHATRPLPAGGCGAGHGVRCRSGSCPDHGGAGCSGGGWVGRRPAPRYAAPPPAVTSAGPDLCCVAGRHRCGARSRACGVDRCPTPLAGAAERVPQELAPRFPPLGRGWPWASRSATPSVYWLPLMTRSAPAWSPCSSWPDDLGSGDTGRILESLGTFLRADVAQQREIAARHSWNVAAARMAVVAPWVTVAALSAQPSGRAAYSSTGGTLLLAAVAVVTAVAYAAMSRLARTRSAQEKCRERGGDLLPDSRGRQDLVGPLAVLSGRAGTRSGGRWPATRWSRCTAGHRHRCWTGCSPRGTQLGQGRRDRLAVLRRGAEEHRRRQVRAVGAGTVVGGLIALLSRRGTHRAGVGAAAVPVALAAVEWELNRAAVRRRTQLAAQVDRGLRSTWHCAPRPD